MTHPHPWRYLREQQQLLVHWRILQVGHRSATDGTNIWISKALLQRERRSNLAHELVHIHRGHIGCVGPTEERRVRHHAARWLLPNIHQVADSMVCYAHDLEQVAEDLWVDRVTVEARLDPWHLHPAEKAILNRRMNE